MSVVRVQALAGNLRELPPQFIRPAHERPETNPGIDGVAVPVISLAKPTEVLAGEIAAACKEWGFFLVTDHGMPPELIRRLRQAGEEFFELPMAEKEKYANDPASGNMEGYGTKMTKNLEEKVEWIDYFFHLLCPPQRVSPQKWPSNPPTYREVTEEYGEKILEITDKLLELLSMGLGLGAKAMKSRMGGDEMELEMKINMYPPCPQPLLALGVEPHTDMSALTVLLSNNVPGLQVWKDGNWVATPHVVDALFVHVGDQAEVMSNGRYKSVLHRSLVNEDTKRMSWAVFCVPPGHAQIGPLPELVSDQNPPKYSTKTYDEYRYRKFNKLPQ